MLDHSAIEKLEFPVVLALTRGAMPLAFEIAQALHAPLGLSGYKVSGDLGGLNMKGRSCILVVEANEPSLVDHKNRIASVALKSGARLVETVREVPGAQVPGDFEVDLLLDRAKSFFSPMRPQVKMGELEMRAVKMENRPFSTLTGQLTLPSLAVGLIVFVVFVHDKNHDHLSPQVHYVAQTLHGAGLGTLLLDINASSHESWQESRIENLINAMRWVEKYEPKLEIGLFGSGAGVLTVLGAAARLAGRIQGIVCQGGSPDLIGVELKKVRAPVLFVVGGEDPGAIDSCKRAFIELETQKDIETIPGVGRSFSEPGAIEAVAHLAADWFIDCFKHASSLAVHQVVS